MKNYANKWIIQRITAAILIPLTFWFVYQCILLSSYGYEETKVFFLSKFNSSLYFILLISMLLHAKLGCETIIEDYVISKNLKKISKLSISIIMYVFMVLTTISLIYIIIHE